MLPCLISTVKSCTRRILHSVLAMKIGQAPTECYTEHIKHTQATKDYWVKCPAMTQSSRGTKRRHYLEFHLLYHNCIALCSYASNPDMLHRQDLATSSLEHVPVFQQASWQLSTGCKFVIVFRIRNISHTADHLPGLLCCLAYCKQSKTGGAKGRGMRLMYACLLRSVV